MPLDFSKLTVDDGGGRLIDPRQIFASLPLDRSKYPYMRDVQGEVLERWFSRREQRDLVIKMNTGGGKTVVGLLALQSVINEGVGPALYLTPDNLLASQVAQEADALGISWTDDPRSPKYRTGQAVCIANVYRLFNGRTVFGLGQGSRLPIGCVLIDDAHACLKTVEHQFSVRIPAESRSYQEMFDLLYPALSDHSRAAAEELKQGDPGVVLAVPPWAWTQLQDRVVPILARSAKEVDQIQWQWPLVRDVVNLCRVAVTSREFHIAPPCLPVDAVPSFSNAPRRLFLTATLADDNVLVTDFGADPSSVAEPIVPKSASDLGDRLILSPFEADPGLDHEALRTFLARLARVHNTVVITPSHKRAQVWSDVADRICLADSIAATVEELQQRHIGLVVFANRYDGIDLPGDACRVLVIDGLPTHASPLERVDAEMVDGTERIARELMQRVEQGMGRGVRSNEDHCVVVLSDLRLAHEVWTYGDKYFSPATAAQLSLSRKVSGQLRGTDISVLGSAVDLVLSRDSNWVAAARAALAPIESKTTSEISDIAIAQRKAFELAQDHRYIEAADELRSAIDTIGERSVRGWAKQLAALYLYQVDRVSADELQKSARADNRSAFRPVGSHLSPTLLKSTLSQSQASATRLETEYGSPADIVLGVEQLLNRLRPDPDQTKDFERAFEEVGLLLGFGAQRPEQEYGAGPDVLWSLGDLVFLVIECKSGSWSDVIHKTELAQLGHSVDWFASKYDGTCRATPVLVHPSRQCGPAAVAADGTKVVTFDRLAALLDRVRDFAAAVSSDSSFDAGAVGKRLMALELNSAGFVSRWCQSVKPAR